MTYNQLENWNIEFFHWINASANPPVFVPPTAYFCAEILLYILALWMVIAWIRGKASIRVGLLYATLSTGLGLGINQLIGQLWYHPRPFEMGIGQLLLKHAPNTSFPSDHGLVFFSIGLALLWLTSTRRLGAIITLTGVIVAWSRIYLGVHFPLDMLGSFVVAIISTGFIYLFLPFIKTTIEPKVTSLYDFFIKTLHLPQSLFPVK